KASKRDPAASKRSKAENDDEEAAEDGEGAVSAPKPSVAKADSRPAQDASTGVVDTESLSRQVGIAQRSVKEKPDSAVAASRQMSKENTEEADEQAAEILGQSEPEESRTSGEKMCASGEIGPM
ncbi:hypothetical protein OY671_012916, partial [Metschnikowia pulcherrima]